MGAQTDRTGGCQTWPRPTGPDFLEADRTGPDYVNENSGPTGPNARIFGKKSNQIRVRSDLRSACTPVLSRRYMCRCKINPGCKISIVLVCNEAHTMALKCVCIYHIPRGIYYFILFSIAVSNFQLFVCAGTQQGRRQRELACTVCVCASLVNGCMPIKISV